MLHADCRASWPLPATLLQSVLQPVPSLSAQAGWLLNPSELGDRRNIMETSRLKALAWPSPARYSTTRCSWFAASALLLVSIGLVLQMRSTLRIRVIQRNKSNFTGLLLSPLDGVSRLASESANERNHNTVKKYATSFPSFSVSCTRGKTSLHFLERHMDKVDLNRLKKDTESELFSYEEKPEIVRCLEAESTRFTKRKVAWLSGWCSDYNMSRSMPHTLEEFKTAVSLPDIELTLRLLKVFTSLLEQQNLTYFIYGGTLIGSLRHHGPIPWDDDTDIIVNYYQRNRVRKVMRQLEPFYYLHSPALLTPWKFYSMDSHKTQNVKFLWKWPFIDIFFFKETEGYVRDVTWSGGVVKFPQEIVFPLERRPYAYLDLLAPYAARDFTALNYQLSKCVSRDWSHRRERKLKSGKKEVDCRILQKYFPFLMQEDSSSRSWGTIFHNEFH